MADKQRSLTGAAARGRTPPGTPSIKERWASARSTGDRTFDPGVACVNGHAAFRWTSCGICIDCKRDRDNAFNAAHKEEHRARSRRSVMNRLEEVAAYQRGYYLRNTEYLKAQSRAWSLAHPEHVRTRHVAWYAKNAPRLRMKMAARYAANPAPARLSKARWKQNNKHRVREADALRRARELGAATGDRKAYAEFVRWSRTTPRVPCYWCRKNTKPGHRHLDHVIPLSKGGADAVANLCVSCPPCNLRKNAKMPEEFAGQSELCLA